MKIPIKNIALSIFIFAGSAFNVLNAQSFIRSLNDSIIKYKAGQPQKSLDFGFLALERFFVGSLGSWCIISTYLIFKSG